MENQSFTRTTPVYRADGVNESERYLKKLCEHSFLSLWSYPSLTRDQGRKNRRGDGKELCDLLVVFGNDVIIFQDKECAFGSSGDLQLDWSRWYRAAIQEGAKQIWGAERWIKESPGLIYLDRLCTQPFPFDFPDPSVARYHRIIVAHGASERCKQELDGSGSLVIMASNADSVDDSSINPPFAIGQVDPSKGFVHIFDDTTLDIVLQTLDTLVDFVAYLTKKEALFSRVLSLYAAGEEELLAEYLARLNAKGEHDFVFPPNSFVILEEGAWSEFSQSQQRVRQLKANKNSYIWDDIIEEFNKHNLAATQHYVSHPLKDIELPLRLLASENRTSRRLLSEELLKILERTPSHERFVRVTKSPCQNGVYYVLMLFPYFKQGSEEENRFARRTHLMDYCTVVKLRCPDADHIIGIATDSGLSGYRSEDMAYYDAFNWSEEEQAHAKNIQKEFNILNTVRLSQGLVQEYPNVDNSTYKSQSETTTTSSDHTKLRRVGRNDPCPCGSGAKYKRCHGK